MNTHSRSVLFSLVFVVVFVLRIGSLHICVTEVKEWFRFCGECNPENCIDTQKQYVIRTHLRAGFINPFLRSDRTVGRYSRLHSYIRI